ncbi:MAG: NrfD/PsrC family molybdoenzyme membrane anchor subunit [Thermodesulfovibrionales bacterium]|jgi:formate-dependent nitrite reductase membrane component NrfD
MEITITGANALTYPHMHVWDWRIAVYLFLGGITAGLLVMSAIANLRKSKMVEADKACCVKGPMLAPFILAVGMFFIMLDVERKFNSFWFFLSFQPLSPMSWGAWGVGLIIPVSFLYGLSVVPAEMKGWLRFDVLKKLSDRLNPHMRILAKINFGLGIFLGIYTGILLSAFVARPLWNSSVLPVLFLTSALSTGAALAIILAKRSAVKLFFTKIDIWLLSAEIVAIVLFFYGHYTSTAPQRASIMPFFSFSSEYFWYGTSILLISILLPLALVMKLMEVKEEHGENLSQSALMKMKLSAVMVLIGGFIIRLAFVYAGQLSSLGGGVAGL